MAEHLKIDIIWEKAVYACLSFLHWQQWHYSGIGFL